MPGRAEHLTLRGLTHRILASRLAFAGLFAVTLAVGTFCLIDGLSWLDLSP